MKCEKCGYTNSQYDIICEECGSPLSIEKNIELQKKYNHKARAIDIEHIIPDQSEKVFDDTKKKVRYISIIIIVLLFIGIIFSGIYFVNEWYSNDIFVKYEEFVKTKKQGVIYIGRSNSTNEQLKQYSDTYDIDYLYISTDGLSRIKKRKLKNDLNIKEINEYVAIIDNGDVMDYINDTDKLESYLQQNNVIPHQVGDAKKVKENFNLALNSEQPTIVYVANNKNELNAEHNEKLENFCKIYSINYVYIEGYYLTDAQKLKLLEKINYSEIHNELMILIDERKVMEVTEFVANSEKDYFELSSNYGIIDIESANKLTKIDKQKLDELISDKSKSIVFFGTNDCSYCDRLKPIIGKISIQNNIEIYYFELDDNNRLEVENQLTELGLDEGKVVTPLVVIVGENQLLDYIIGFSDKTIYIDKFSELGIIR